MCFANCCINSCGEQSHKDGVREATVEDQLKQRIVVVVDDVVVVVDVVVVDDRFYVALFSALEQTHCARMGFYMSDLLFIAFFVFFFCLFKYPPKW